MEDFDNSPLVRTDFSSERVWTVLVRAATGVSPDGFQAHLRVVDDRSYDGAEIGQLTDSDWHDASVLFVADAEAQSNPERPILCVDLLDNRGSSFRCIPSELWGVENNLRLANMDFQEFAEAVDSDGVFRGFH